MTVQKVFRVRQTWLEPQLRASSSARNDFDEAGAMAMRIAAPHAVHVSDGRWRPTR